MILVVDNYDSFTYNLVQYLGEFGCEVQVVRNDTVSVEEVRALRPSHIVISPGPGDPSHAGISIDVVLKLGQDMPILGVCLGHQCIAAAFGGRVERAFRLMHGKTSLVYHQNNALFLGIPSPFVATRYHSLVVTEPLPDALEMIAITMEGEVMALRHKVYPIYGVQFHPESVLTQFGRQVIHNLISSVHNIPERMR